jgi:hypothetical protein
MKYNKGDGIKEEMGAKQRRNAYEHFVGKPKCH